MRDIERLKLMLIRLNLMKRIHGIQILVKLHEKAIQRLLSSRRTISDIPSIDH